MDFLCKEFNIKNNNDWYNITFQDIIDRGGKGLTKQYKSMKELLEAIYIGNTWDIFYFKRLPQGFAGTLLRNHELQENFVKFLVKKFDIKSIEDWYLVSGNQIRSIVAIKLMDAMTIVKKFYPNLEMKYFESK